MKRREKDGVERVKVSYPKFKNGEATVRDVRVEPNFGKHLDLQMWTWKFLFWKIWKSIIFTEFSVFILGYVEEIFQTYMNASRDELKDANTKLYEKTPAAMNTMLEKQPRAEALLKRQQRSKMVVTDVPPTTPGTLHHITAVHSTNLL